MGARMRRQWVGMVLLSGLAFSLGCTRHQTLVPPNMNLGPEYQSSTTNTATSVIPDLPGKPKTPQASTCIAFGDWMITAGDNARNHAHKAASDEQRQQFLDQSSRCYENAKQLYHQALKLDAKDMRAYLGLAKLAQYEKRFDQANEHYQRVLKEYPKDASIWFEYGLCLAKQKQWNESLECMQKACQLDGKNTNYTSQYAWALARVGRFEESWNLFRGLYGDGPAYLRVAQMAMHLGQWDKSKHFAQLALQIDPELAQARELLIHLNNPAAQAEAQSAIQQIQYVPPPH